jgi:hypothetical protein
VSDSWIHENRRYIPFDVDEFLGPVYSDIFSDREVGGWFFKPENGNVCDVISPWLGALGGLSMRIHCQGYSLVFSFLQQYSKIAYRP